MTQLIQLDPSSPPMHPMLPMIKKRVKKVNQAGISESEVSALNQHLCDYLGVRGFRIAAMGSPDVISNYISASTVFLNTTHGLYEANTKHGVEYFIRAIDFSTGLLFAGNIPQQPSIIDVTGLMPYSDVNGFTNKYVMLRLNGSLGVDLDWVVLMEEGISQSLIVASLTVPQKENVRLMNFLMDDYQLQKKLAIRDYKYKAALIENLISSNVKLNFYIKTPKERSKTIFSFTTSGLSATDFANKMKEKGFEVGLNADENGNDHLLIANFINHSKEQIEAFVDAVNAVL